MNDSNINQTVTFLGSGNSQNEKEYEDYLLSSKSLISELDDKSHRFLLDGQFNIERVLTSTINKCSNLCLKNFKIDKITKSEEDCLLKCQYNYLKTYKLGLGVMNSLINNQ